MASRAIRTLFSFLVAIRSVAWFAISCTATLTLLQRHGFCDDDASKRLVAEGSGVNPRYDVF